MALMSTLSSAAHWDSAQMVSNASRASDVTAFFILHRLLSPGGLLPTCIAEKNVGPRVPNLLWCHQ